jgi:6-phosphogluconolactonase/glucosamine-6-phosphate isomerase/deaminase/DNA-binding XRE family transcriptional regulator
MTSHLGEFVQRLRRLKALSQEALAEKAGIQIKTLRGIERGIHEPRPRTVSKLAVAFGLQPEDLSSSERDGLTSRNSTASAIKPVWPARLLVCASSAIALYACARMLTGCLKTTDLRSLMLPTGRTAALLFESVLRDASLDLSLLHETHLFIDTETFGVSADHPASRQRFVRNSLIAGLKRRNIAISDENMHFFNGCLNSSDIFAQYDAMVQRYRPSAHILAVSPQGEIIGYDPGEISDISTCADDRCKVMHLHEDGRRYIDPNQPSRAIITIGLGNLLEAEHIILPILHPSKSGILAKTLAGPIDDACPATMLRLHDSVTIVTTAAIMEPIAADLEDLLASRDDVDERMKREGLL